LKALKKLYGARFRIPARLLVEIQPIGAGPDDGVEGIVRQAVAGARFVEMDVVHAGTIP
jgi:hypothetical protein